MAEQRRLQSTSAPAIPLSILNEDYQPPEPEVVGDASSVWDAATERQWVYKSVQRQDESITQGGEDVDFNVTPETLQEYSTKGYSEQELDFIAGSLSKENFQHRLSRIDTDREVKKTVDAYGLKGFGIEMAAAVFDPTMIPALLASAPVAASAKVSRIGRLGAAMLTGATEGAVSEYVLKQGDTQRTDQDVIMSAVGGMAFGGALNLAAMGASSARNALTRANTVEKVQSDNFKMTERGEAYNRANEALTTQNKNASENKVFLTEKDIITKLQEEVGVRSDVLSKKGVKGLKDEFRAYKKGRKEVIEKIKSRPNMRPSARAAEIKQVEDAIARRQTELDAQINYNSTLVSSNSKLDALQQGKIPEELQARYTELKAEAGEFDVTPAKLVPIKSGATKVDEAGIKVSKQSIGAARTRGEFDDIETFDELLTESDVDEVVSAISSAEQLADTIPRNNRFGEVPAPLRSLYTEVDSAPDRATRGILAMLAKNPQRTTEGLQSAEELSETLFMRAAADYEDYQSSFSNYLKQKGINPLKIGDVNKAELEFSRETVMYQTSGNLLSNQPVDGDTPIMLAAKARSRLYEQGLRNNQDYNVIGFENIKHRHEYHSIVFSQDNIARMTEQKVDFMRDAIASAYQTGAIKLSRENALKVAENQIARAMMVKGQPNKSFTAFMSDAEYKLLDAELREKGVDEDVIADIKDSIFNEEMRGEISPRAMFSLRPNMKARSGDVWFVDMLDTSIERNMKYVSDSAANAGIASHGFRSRHQLQRAIVEARDSSVNHLREEVGRYKEGTKARSKAEEAYNKAVAGDHAKTLDEFTRLLYREPLEDGDGLKDVSRLLRKATAVVRLRSTGLATIPEFGSAAVRNGIVTTLKELPSSRWFDFRRGSVQKDKYMSDFNRTFSATGHQEYLFGKDFYNGSDFDDATKSRLEKIDKKLGTALDITMTVNGFKTFQHGGEEMVARSMVSNLRDMAKKGKITRNIRSSLIKTGGMSESQVNEVIEVFKQYPDMDVFDSVRVMEPSLRNALSTAMRNNIGHSFLRMTIGEQPAYMNKEMGKMMTTLMSFTIGSYEKMLLRGIKNERAVLLATLAGQAMLGYGALVANTYIQAQNMEGRERDKYIEDKLSDEGLFWGTTARVGMFATPMIPLQMLNTLGALPEEMRGVGRMGGVQSSALVADTVQAASAAGQLALKDQNKREQEADWNTIKRVVPWYNSTLYNLTVGTATKD